ncbi:hypothetical protein MJM59_28565, partial [Salmonella enterica subsp. enterica serovar Montevideo]|nr:hypothetical protein [Salmonella enterica subsp. enterica serovar Montevideo]
PGPAWSASDPAIAGAAPSLTRVHQRADALMRELDPRTTTELIAIIKVDEPARRKAGIIVPDINTLLDKLKNEEKVI